MLSLELVKQHCRIEPNFVDDDTLLNTYISAAVRFVEKKTDRKLYESESDDGFAQDEDALLLDADITAAMLLMIGHWYSNREAVSQNDATSVMPLAAEDILQFYRFYGL
ncbi:uncharacterized phage protein (possible DNA packaging) [Plesiomonas shigelloides]|uniref:head-tail connector protein n=1 Tax=Plesiomonas shigelloides TaxID=703 RepID=UPI0007EE071C|nr:head-tail connector protein [Plesiomonas shigelloides]KAB7669177.1 phage gp6-like head-tail connector protein [Plesiomonas shigelloides]SBT60200.1 uncharacterized phage protein (possible DNA packaging) [Plesiomonas shigelloides]HAD39023.1 phage gp6-like head-tail connector protein [Plesiomonas shigelloides]